MPLDYKNEWEKFNKLSFNEQKEIIIELLEFYRGKGEIFDMIYDYILRGEGVTLQDFQDIYKCLIETAYTKDKEDEKIGLEKLESIKSRALQMREKERQESEITQKEASKLINML